MNNQQEQQSWVVDRVIEAVEKTGKVSFFVEPSESTVGKTAEQLKNATFKIGKDDVSVTHGLKDMAFFVMQIRATAERSRRARATATELTSPRSAMIDNGTTAEDIDAALEYLRQTKRIG